MFLEMGDRNVGAQQQKQDRRRFISEKLKKLSDNKTPSQLTQLTCAYITISNDHVQTDSIFLLADLSTLHWFCCCQDLVLSCPELFKLLIWLIIDYRNGMFWI